MPSYTPSTRALSPSNRLFTSKRIVRRLSVALAVALCAVTLLTPLATTQKIDPYHPEGPRTIRGVKWLDLNANGRREPDEPGLPGWTIVLSSARGREIGETKTDAAGNFQFAQLQPGEYTLSEAHQPGWVQTFPKTAALSVTLRDRAVEVSFGNRPCGDDVARYDRDGKLILPPDADPSVPPTDETGTEQNGHVSDLYGAYGDTSTDLWYDKFPCQQSLDDGSEPMPTPPDLASEIAAAGVPSLQNVNQKVNSLGPIVYNKVGSGQGFGPLGVVESPRFKSQAPLPLNTSQPYSGRDIIYIHGLMPDAILDKLTGSNPQAFTKWPQNQTAFEGNGYWKQAAKYYWSDHIGRLYAAGGKNRFLVVAWPSTQRLDVAVHAVLTQIARAMTMGKEVVNPFPPGNTDGFCQANCVIVSHSAGALVADVAMAVAEKTKTVPLVASQLGHLGFIPDHMKVHVAFQGAFSGSHYATAVEAVALGLVPVADMCALVTAFLSALTKGNSPVSSSVCSQLSALPDSIIVDLVPEVSQAAWGPLVHLTPVPVLTVAGGHPSYTSPLKHLLLRGFDDGILTMNSQCANPLPPAGWPSGYIPVPSPLDVKVYDRGISKVRANRYFIDQMFDKYLAPASLPPNLAAAGCTPFISPTGMIQPFAGGTPDPLRRYTNHYSFIQSASDHMIGPVGTYDKGGCKNRDYLVTAGSFQNNEEERVITNPVVYQPDARFAGDPQPLVNSAMKTAVSEEVRSKKKKLFSFKKKTIYLYIWKRYYHLLDGYECMDEVDYVHQYVVR
jgi:SdrD B-like domain